MATGNLYELKQLEIESEDVLIQVGGKDNWTAMSSALHPNLSYEFVSDVPFEYMDFKDRYLVTKVDSVQDSSNLEGAASKQTSKKTGKMKRKFLLAYCFCIRVNEADYGEVQAQIPSAIIEDIIADVELMKG